MTVMFKWCSLQTDLIGESGSVLHRVTFIELCPSIDGVIVIVSDVPSISFVAVLNHFQIYV